MIKLEVIQVESEKKNSFEIKYNDTLKYKAKLPFISFNDPLNLEKLRMIKIYDLDGNVIYTTDYNYIENLKEEIIPMKFLVTGSQKFNQLVFTADTNIIKIYYEEKEIWNNRYVIELNEKQYYCYSIEDGYIRHFPIYDGDKQIGEILKSNVIIDFKDNYCCYIKDGYESISDGVVALLLYFDRSEYSSSYLINKSYNLTKRYSYNKTNKYYDKEWVKNNFGDEFYKKVDEDVNLVKEKIKHPLKSYKELWNSMPENNKKLLILLLIVPWVIIFIVLLIVLIGMFLFK